MGVKVRIDPIERVTAATLRASLSEPEQRKAAAKIAQRNIEAAITEDARALGAAPLYTTTVDGRPGAPLESVNPNGGVIVTEFKLIADVITWIGKAMFDGSAVITGNYRRGHQLFADGALVPAGAPIPQAKVYVFVNAVPYARRLEIGVTRSGRAFVIQVPPRLYERVATEAAQRFGNIANIRFGFIAAADGALMDYGGAASRHRKNRHGGGWSGGAEWQARAPSITVTAR